MVSSQVAASVPAQFLRHGFAVRRGLRHIEQSDRAVGALDGEAAACEGDILLGGFEHVRGDLLALLDDLVGRLAHDDARHPHRAGRVRAAAFVDDVGVAFEDVHVFERNAEPFRHALRERRFVALAARERADHDVDAAVRMHGDVGALARIAAGRLDVVAKADAA